MSDVILWRRIDLPGHEVGIFQRRDDHRELPAALASPPKRRNHYTVRASRLSHGLALRKSDWQKIPMRKARQAVLELAGREVVITNPDKPFFPQAGHTKLHLVRYYAAVAEGALRGIAGRPIVLKRYVDGAAGEPFFQKRGPEQRPEWIETVERAPSVGADRARDRRARRRAASVDRVL